MTEKEIKLRRLCSQHLTAPVPVERAASDLCGIQAQFPGYAVHALRIRCGGFDEGLATWKLVKNWTLRGTMHMFPREDLPLYLAFGEHCRENEWTDPSFWNRREDWALTPERQKQLSAEILTALEAGPKTREELKTVCREQGMTLEEEGSMFHPWGGGIRELCQRGFTHYEAGMEKRFCLTPAVVPLSREKAELELARRYFRNYGPATVRDAMYFFRATKKQVLSWLEKLPLCSFQMEGRTYYYLENSGTGGENIPACLFLAGFDPLMLGYEKTESFFLPREYLRGIFNLTGIVMPALLLDGRVAGRWKEKNGVLTVEAFRDLTAGERRLVEDNARALWKEMRKLSVESL